jgi:CRISPR-associated protein Csx10
LPQSWVLSAGSVFRCPAGVVDANTLRAIVEEGIGERRVEGFGRVAVNWQTQKELTKVKIKAMPQSFEGTLSSMSQELAERMATRRLRFILEEQLVKMLDDIFNKLPKHLPTSAQLSRVRVAARHAFLTHDLSKITEHMDFIKDHGAKDDWERTYFGDKSFFNWIKENCQLTKEEFEKKFSLSTGLPKIAGKTAVLDGELRAEFCARYIDGVMRLGIRKNKESEEKI